MSDLPENWDKYASAVASGIAFAAAVWTRLEAWRRKKAERDAGQDTQLSQLADRVAAIEERPALPDLRQEYVRREELEAFAAQVTGPLNRIEASQRRILARKSINDREG